MCKKITGKTVKIKEEGDWDMAKMEFGELDVVLSTGLLYTTFLSITRIGI